MIPTQILNSNFLRSITSCMEIRTGNIRNDYSEVVDTRLFANGLLQATWDTRYGQIVSVAEQQGLDPLVADRKIWKAAIVLDPNTQTLYAFTSTPNYNKVLHNIAEGNKTHYFYLLAINSDEPVGVQTSLFESTDDDAERLLHAKEILEDKIKLAKHFVVIHYNYKGIAFGTISLLDNQGTELSSMSLDKFLANNQESIAVKIDKPHDNENITPDPSKPLVSWKGKSKEIK